MDGENLFLLEDDEPTIAVPQSVIKDILEKISMLVAETKKTQEDIADLSKQLRIFETIQGTRDQKNAENVKSLMKAIAAVSQDFVFSIYTIEDVDEFDKNLKKCSIEAERMVI